MAPIFDIMAYNLEVDWLLTWFPIRAAADLKEPRIRGGTFRHKSTEDVFDVGNSVIHLLGQGAKGDGDPLAPNNVVFAFITIRVNKEGSFEADLEVNIGNSIRKKSLTLAPGTRIPFLITVHASGDNQIVRDTAVAFQGVLTTGVRLSLLEVVAKVLGP